MRRRPMTALIGGAATFVLALVGLMANLTALEKTIPPPIAKGIIEGFQAIGFFKELPPEERQAEGVVNYSESINPSKVCFNNVAADETIINAHPKTRNKVNLVDEPSTVTILPDSKSACATWSARDPNNGHNSAANIAVIVHVKKLGIPAEGMRAVAVLLTIIGSALIGCIAVLSVNRLCRGKAGRRAS